MARLRARADANQTRIVEAFRAMGFAVQHLHTVGGGCPDLLIARRGNTYPVEVKDGAKPPSRRRLTKDEQAWHDAWPAPVLIVESVDDVVQLSGRLP